MTLQDGAYVSSIIVVNNKVTAVRTDTSLSCHSVYIELSTLHQNNASRGPCLPLSARVNGALMHRLGAWTLQGLNVGALPYTRQGTNVSSLESLDMVQPFFMSQPKSSYNRPACLLRIDPTRPDTLGDLFPAATHLSAWITDLTCP